MYFFAGIDLGSTSSKAVIIDEDGEIVGSHIQNSGRDYRKTAESVLKGALEQASCGRGDIQNIIATGYGRFIEGLDAKAISEITCCAVGSFFLHPESRIVIDVGGQDSKVIKVNGSGRVLNFSLNDKCAAGTGRFLERIATSLDLTLDEMGKLSIHAERSLPISNTCTVFAETEVISRISSGEPVEGIVRGLHNALASRIYTLAVRLKIETDIFMCGGGAKNIGLVSELRRIISEDIVLPSNVDARLVPAIGAALKAKDMSARDAA